MISSLLLMHVTESIVDYTVFAVRIVAHKVSSGSTLLSVQSASHTFFSLCWNYRVNFSFSNFHIVVNISHFFLPSSSSSCLLIILTISIKHWFIIGLKTRLCLVTVTSLSASLYIFKTAIDYISWGAISQVALSVFVALQLIALATHASTVWSDFWPNTLPLRIDCLVVFFLLIHIYKYK